MKRLFTRCLLVTLLITMSITTGWAQKSVLDESFASSGVPKGWSMSKAYWVFKGNGALFSCYLENGADTLTSPILSLSGTYKPSVAITYSNKANNGKVNEFKVLYRASVTDEWSVWKTMDEANDQVSVKDVLPDGLANVQIALAVAYKLGAETRITRLAVENKTEAADAPTGLKATDVTTTSATLSWDPCNSPLFQQYNLKVNSSKMTDMSAEADILNRVNCLLIDRFFELEDLTPNREYWAYVQYDCGDGDVSPWAEFNFTTPCTSISAPFAESFEEALSDCYTIINNGKAEVSGEFAHNSTKAFKFVSAKGKDNYLIFPEFSGNVKEQQISFWAAAQESGNTYARTITVGVCAERNASSFTEVATLELPKARQWEFITVSLAAYAGSGKFIALKAANADKENRLFVDDIQIEKASSCPKPMFVGVSEITPNGAKLAWVKAGSETEWNLVVSTKPLADPEDFSPDAAKGEFAGTISANPYSITGLKANTTYFAYLQAGCGSSEWTKAVEFKTAKPVSYPYSEHFDRLDPDAYDETTTNAIPNGWVMDDRCITSGTNYDKQYTSATYRPFVTTKENHKATAYVNASLKLAGASSTGYMSIAMLPAMPKPVNTMMITFWAKASNGNQTLKVGVANTQTNDLAQGKQLGANITEVGEATIIKDEWKQYKVLLTNYTGEGRYITLAPGAPYSGTPYIYIDDIEIDEAPDCNAVSTVSATATGIDKATAEWTDASSSTSWTIKVSSTEIDPSAADGDIVAAKTVNTKSYDITGMAMGQTYYVYVSPTCGDAWMSTTVTTLVGLQVPYYNDFTNENTGANANRGPKNWKLGFTYTDTPGATSSNWPHVNTTAWTNAPTDVVKNSVYFNNSTTASTQFPYAIMPELLNADVKDLKIAFYAYWNNAKPTSSVTNYACVVDQYYGVLRIGVVNSPSDISKANAFKNVTEVASVRCKGPKEAEYFVVDMSSYTGSGKYIVFYQDTAKNNYMMIDNLSITLASAPQQVTNVSASEQTETTAKLTWTENGKATKWEVKVFAEAPEDIDAATPIFTQMVTAKEVTVTGLTHSTQYFAYVRSIQDNGNGAWGNASFYSECGAWAVPFYEDWNSYATGGTTNNTFHPCYNVEHSTASTWPYVRLYTGASSYHPSQSNLLYMTAGTGKVCQLEFPKLNAPINTLQMEMEAQAYSSYAGAKYITFFGVVTSDGTFHEVAQRTSSAQKTWEPWTVDFSGYTGEEGVIAIRLDPAMAAAASGTTATTQYIFIENVKISAIPVCKQIQPNDMEAENIDSVSATIKWPAAEASAWNLKVSTKELDDPATESADVFDGAMTANSKDLANLEDNTWHYVYVQTVRPEKECVGEWSRAFKFKTLCKKQVFPYLEDFNSYATGTGNLPDCSTICGEDADHSYVSSSTTLGNRLYINQKAKEHKNYFVFPALNTEDVRKLQLNMQVWVGTTATTTYRYQVGIMTDPNDPSTFVSLHSEELMGSSNAYDRSYKFDGYQGDETGTKFGGYIAISPRDYTLANGNTNYTSMYIDNVTIDFIETCIKPVDLQADSVGTYGAKLIWNTDDKTATHRVRIFDNAEAKANDDTFVKEVVVKDSMAIIEGLNSLTKYYAFVRKECAESDLSKWSSAFQFKTECPATRAIPYEEGFDGDTDPLADYCWASFMLQGPSACTTDYNSKSSTSAKKDGTRGLYLQYTEVPSQAGGSCVGTHRSAAITPALEVESLKDLVVYFDVRRSGSTNAGLKIEAVSDDTKDADAIYITTINDITADWSKAYVKLADYYTSVQAYKRLRFSTTTASGIYIDNLVITNDLNVVLPVEALKLQMLTENSIKFSFVESTPTVKQWQVAYVAAGGDIADATIKTIDATEYTIEGLAANTSYDIYVRGNVDGDVWVGPLTASTFQTPAPLPLIAGFEEDEEPWNLYNVQTVQGNFYPNFWIVGSAEVCGGTGDKALFITNDSANYEAYGNATNMNPAEYPWMSSVTSTSYVWATRNINIADAGTYKFEFKIKVPSTYGTSYSAYAQLIPAGATFKAGTATLISGATRSGSATTNTNGCYVVMNSVYNTPDWKWVNTSVDIETPGIYTLAIYWTNSSAVAANPYETGAAIDSVIVEEYLCTTPKNIEYTNRAANEVSLKWFGGKCKKFEYVLSRYAKLGNPALIDNEDKVAYGTLTDGPAITLSNLLPQTDYSFYVRTICEEGTTDWIEFDFVTPCSKYDLPYTEIFSETPECWTLSAATATTQKYKTSDMSTADVWTCLQLNKGGLAILPELNVPMNKVQIDLEVFNTTNLGAVSIGVMDNTWDPSTFKEVKFCQTQYKLTSSSSAGNPLVLEPFSHMFNLYKGEGKVLAIKNATDNAIYVKDVKLTELPDCVRPQQIELTFVTENSVTVNWIAGVEEAWEIKINDQIIENVTTNPYKITGLEQGTVYEVSVRALCDAEHNSDWSVPVKFQTDCGVNPLPMAEDFSGLKAENKRATITCWSNMATDLPIENVFNGSTSPYEPSASTYYTYMWIANYLEKLGDEHQLLFFGSTLLNSGPKYRWMVTPQYAIEGMASLSFDVKHVDNQNMMAKPNGRFFVAISTDNGATWKKADATEIEGIDTVYTTKSVSLDKYAGQNIRVAFYMENLGGETRTKGSGLFTLLDNIRMNCTDVYPFKANACQGHDYEGNGFYIEASNLPVAGKDSMYYRFAANTNAGCDSIVTLTLTTHTAKVANVEETICQGEVYTFGPYELTDPSPAGQPYYISGSTEAGCDSTIYLTLHVNPSDTVNAAAPITVDKSELPKQIDEYLTIAADEPVGQKILVAKMDACHFKRYDVTVTDDAAGIVNITADVESIDVYDALGRKVQTFTPNAGEYQLDLPTGMYMVRKTMTNGQIENIKLYIR